MIFNVSMATRAKSNQITQAIRCLVISLKQSIRDDMVYGYDSALSFPLPFAADLTSEIVSKQRGATLMIPVFSPSLSSCAIFVHRIIAALFVYRHKVSHATARAKAPFAASRVLGLVNFKFLAAYFTRKFYEVFWMSSFGTWSKWPIETGTVHTTTNFGAPTRNIKFLLTLGAHSFYSGILNHSDEDPFVAHAPTVNSSAGYFIPLIIPQAAQNG